MVIGSVGMISAVGHDAASSTAAIRAGVGRPRPLPGLATLDLDAGAARAAVGHPIDGVTNGFAGVGLWKRLGERAVSDLLRQGSNSRDRSRWSSAGLLLVLPLLDPHRFLLDEAVDPEALRSDVGVALVELLELPIVPSNVEVLCGGHAGTLAALEMAIARISSGVVERCVVLAVDSYVDDCSLAWLASGMRLKMDEEPTGLVPGEAGGCFIVESAAAARRAGNSPRVAVKTVRTGHTRKRWSDSTGRDGIELARTLETVVAGGAPFAGDVLIDLNGEGWRAREIGGALTRLQGVFGPGVRWLTPATSLGDTGAASAAVAVCVAVGAHQRGWARGAESLVVSMSDDGAVGAARIGALHPDRG